MSCGVAPFCDNPPLCLFNPECLSSILRRTPRSHQPSPCLVFTYSRELCSTGSLGEQLLVDRSNVALYT